ncbi:MAG TPA: FHA domain-containing protein [Gemmatimonadaceae bacterium]|nr:FHA domain-containing protein [Gemmatimonadaceae bacterium]
MWLATSSATRELRDGEIVVGGGADADWRVPSADLMPRHFTIIVHGLNASLKPTSQDNVVVVNGRQLGVASHLLNDGDEILAGNERFVFGENAPPTVVTAAGAGAASRVFLIDEATNTAHELVNRSTTIGRDPSNAILLRDATASRFHAEVRREAGGFVLHSMGSSGTAINGAAATAPVLLNVGDVVEVAFTKLRFSGDVGDAEQPGAADDREELWSRRNPTLATSKISVVTPDAATKWKPWLWVAIAVVLAGVVYAAFAVR